MSNLSRLMGTTGVRDTELTDVTTDDMLVDVVTMLRGSLLTGGDTRA